MGGKTKIIDRQMDEGSRNSSPIPEGSSIFQRVLGQLYHPSHSNCSNSVESVSMPQYSTDKMMTTFQIEAVNDVITESANKNIHSNDDMNIRCGPKKLEHHVQWIDESDTIMPVARTPTSSQMHTARLFMKTTPKPILKT